MRSHRQRALRLLPAALLITGIAVHGVRIVALEEDPQRGSAFAMFASVDIGATRRVLATVPDDPTVRLEVPDSLAEQQSRLKDTPSEESARRFGLLLLELTWDVDGDTATAGGGTSFDQLRIEVVGIEAEGRTFGRQVLTDLVVRREGS